MRYATYLSGGRRQVGVVSDDGQSLRPLALAPREAERGVLALIERSARGEDMPPVDGAPVPVRAALSRSGS